MYLPCEEGFNFQSELADGYYSKQCRKKSLSLPFSIYMAMQIESIDSLIVFVPHQFVRENKEAIGSNGHLRFLVSFFCRDHVMVIEQVLEEVTMDYSSRRSLANLEGDFPLSKKRNLYMRGISHFEPTHGKHDNSMHLISIKIH
jgi:hypothetical protein